MKKSFFQNFLFTVSMLFWNIVAFAQEKDVDINVKSEGGEGFLSANLLWLLLVVAVILVLVAVVTSRGSTDHTHIDTHHEHHH